MESKLLLLVPILLATIGCGGDGAEKSPDGPRDTGVSDAASWTDTADTNQPDTASDADVDADNPATACATLYGLPSERTGLSPEQCSPVCECEGSERFEPSLPDETRLAELESWTLLDPPALLTEDPYLMAEPAGRDPEAVCAVVKDPDDSQAYRLTTYPSDAAAAADDGATITHTGACGLCSSLQNLAVYVRNTELTDPVRNCGLRAISEGFDANVACLMEIGFDEACAQIWAYNTTHTREACLVVCLEALTAPFHTEDGSLNPCLQCDEDQSGAVFKAIAGRTRRNSGLPSAICRPCETVKRVVHEYP